METATYETTESIFQPVTDEAEDLIESFLLEDIEFEILNNRNQDICQVLNNHIYK